MIIKKHSHNDNQSTYKLSRKGSFAAKNIGSSKFLHCNNSFVALFKTHSKKIGETSCKICLFQCALKEFAAIKLLRQQFRTIPNKKQTTQLSQYLHQGQKAANRKSRSEPLKHLCQN